ncbi:amidohydrolase [Clostridium thailandense]|nr:amidohydrolase [Clostridium thailandense]
MEKIKKMDKLIESVEKEVIGWRRHFHQNPELSFEETETSQFIYDTLLSLGNMTVSRPTKTSVVARLIGAKPGKVIAFRADIDALPIQEENDLSYKSKNDGVMHACGHDGHAAVLLGAAKIMSHFKEEMSGEVRFIFQHAEEIPPGGAYEMVKAGVMEGVDEVYAIHIMALAPIGKIDVASGIASSGNDAFKIKIQGKGGHSSMPNEAIDPIVIGSEIVSNLQHIVSRQINPYERVVVSVTKFHAGDTYNIIPDIVELEGSVRTFKPEIRKEIPVLMERIIKGICEAHGATYKFDYNYGYDMIKNNEDVTKFVEETIINTFGADKLRITEPMMASEDFSAFANEAPGCFVIVGAKNEEKGIIYPHHHPRFNIDENSLNIALEYFVSIASGRVLL